MISRPTVYNLKPLQLGPVIGQYIWRKMNAEIA